MEQYATFTKSFEECLRDKPTLTSNGEIIVVINYVQYVVKINDNKCKYYKVLRPREI